MYDSTFAFSDLVPKFLKLQGLQLRKTVNICHRGEAEEFQTLAGLLNGWVISLDSPKSCFLNFNCRIPNQLFENMQVAAQMMGNYLSTSRLLREISHWPSVFAAPLEVSKI
jgi:hypothetical protein